jgi:hypothetical protein
VRLIEIYGAVVAQGSLLSKTDSSKLEKWKGAGREPPVNSFHLGMSVSAYQHTQPASTKPWRSRVPRVCFDQLSSARALVVRRRADRASQAFTSEGLHARRVCSSTALDKIISNVFRGVTHPNIVTFVSFCSKFLCGSSPLRPAVSLFVRIGKFTPAPW